MIGLGYVGLPLAVEFGKTYSCVGYDVNEARIVGLRQNKDVTLETTAEELTEAKNLSFTTDPAELDDCNVYIAGKIQLPFAKVSSMIAATIYAVHACRKHDVIHIHGLGSAVYVFSLVGGLMKRAVVVKVPRTGEGSYLRLVKKSRLRTILFGIAKRGIRSFVILTPDGRDELHTVGVSEDRIMEIPNGVEIPDVQQEKPIDPPLKVCFAGRLIERKKVDQLVEAVAEARKQDGPDIRLTIMGGGSELEPLRDKVDRLGLAADTVFTDDISRDKVLSELARNHVFVLPSRSEGMSNALLQACAQRCVSVAADIPQNRIVLRHEETGFLFQTTDELASHLIRLADRAERNKIADQAYREINERFSIGAVARRYRDFYDKVTVG